MSYILLKYHRQVPAPDPIFSGRAYDLPEPDGAP